MAGAMQLLVFTSVHLGLKTRDGLILAADNFQQSVRLVLSTLHLQHNKQSTHTIVCTLIPVVPTTQHMTKDDADTHNQSWPPGFDPEA